MKQGNTKKTGKKSDLGSEKKENIAAIVIFLVLMLIIVAAFTRGFGLLKKGEEYERVDVRLGDDPFKGNTNASVLIIAFSDYDCGYCKNAEQTMQNILEKYPEEIIYVFKDYPLTRAHPHSYNASLAAECAKEQGMYWEYHDYLYEHSDQMGSQYLKEYAKLLGLDSESFNKCFEQEKYSYEIEEDIEAARNAGVSGTPTFFINGIKVIGAKPEKEFISIIKQEIS